jgi:hypothetical protein
MIPESHSSLMQRLGITAEHLRVTATVTAGILLANVLDREAMVVHANDPLGKQAALALPSALPAPELSGPGHPATDTAVEIGTTAISLLAVQSKNNTSTKELAAIAVAAQVGACAVDAAVERSGWLTQAERAQEDVGFSAISVAWFTKFLLDRASQSKEHAKRWYTGLAAFAVTVGGLSPLYEGSQGGKLDATSHLAGLAVGGVGYLWVKGRRAETAPAS